MSAGLPSFDEAAALVAAYARGLSAGSRKVERVELANAAGRVLARAVVADEDQPPFARSTRDGYACRAAEASSQVCLRVAGMTHAGQAPAGPLAHGAAWEIMTGAPVPEGADAVVMLEHIERDADGIRLLPKRSLKAGENIVARGAQAQRGAELLATGTRLGAAQIAVAASCGCASVEVYARPKVAILTTGDELVPVEGKPGPGQIRNSNAPMLTALVAGAGGEAWVLPTAGDTAEALDDALDEVVKGRADLLLISGGVSAGQFDLVEPALARMGARFHFTGVRIQPGKPLVFGEAATEKGALPFFGLPGNPISSAATFMLFGAPVLGALAGGAYEGPRFLMAQLKEPTERSMKAGLTRFLPAWCEFGAESVPQVAAVPWHGSGDLPAFGKSNCFLVVPEEAGGLEAGTMVRILMV
jgi:molybdopterin molybdotransferase